jgi:hypothetical protein
LAHVGRSCRGLDTVPLVCSSRPGRYSQLIGPAIALSSPCCAGGSARG